MENTLSTHPPPPPPPPPEAVELHKIKRKAGIWLLLYYGLS